MAILALLYSLFTQHLSLFFGSVPLPSILSTLFLQETRCECQCKSGRAKRRTEEARCRCFFVQSILNKAYRCSKCKKVYETSLHITNGSKNVKNTKMAQKGFHGNLECNSHIFAVDLRDHFYFIPQRQETVKKCTSIISSKSFIIGFTSFQQYSRPKEFSARKMALKSGLQGNIKSHQSMHTKTQSTFCSHVLKIVISQL